MEDAFSVFGLERRPLIDETLVKETYLRLAGAWHPDVSSDGEEKFHQLQDAYKILREPASRLKHLIELEFPAFEGSTSSVPHAELFLRAGGAIQVARALFSRLENSPTLLVKTLLAEEVKAALEQIRETSELVRGTREGLDAHLRELDDRWPKVSAPDLAALSASFAFVSRWMSQLSEWKFRLENG